MNAQLTTRPVEQVVAAVQALDLETVKMRMMDPVRGEGWTRPYADSIEIAYKNYLTMLAKYQEDAEDIILSEDVDEFWHTHILQTTKYANDCERVFGNFLHHEPHVGEVTSEDIELKERQAEKTRQLYEREFGSAQDAAWAGDVIKAENAASSAARIQAGNAASSAARIQAEHAASSAARIQAGNAASSAARIRAERAASSAARIGAANAASSAARIQAGNAASSAARIRAERAASSAARIGAANAASSAARIRATNAASSAARIRAANDARLREPMLMAA